MNNEPSRISSIVAAAVLLALATAADAQAVQTRTAEIVAQPLNQALSAFARQTGLQLIYVSELADGQDSKPIPAGLTVKEALTRLLAGTALTFEFLNDRTVRIFEASAVRPASTTSSEQSTGTAPLSEVSSGDVDEKKSHWSWLRLAQVDASKAASASSAGADASQSSTLEEIVVTAQKKQERLRDVPVPVTVIDAASLVETNQLQLKEYFSNAPGVTLSPSFLGGYSVTIRGLNSGGGNATVGTLIDDVPVGGSTFINSSAFVPEIDPSELSSIEVLRGPQGTLYGNSSIGGLIKYVTIDPSTEGFSARVTSGLSSIRNGDGAGYQLSAAANVPVGEAFAVRASGFTRSDAGYIDNLYTGSEGANRLDVSGAHLSGLWKPSETLSLKLSAFYQHSNRPSGDEVDPSLGGFRQNLKPGIGAYQEDVQFYSAVLKATVGRFDLTSLTGYSVDTYSYIYDFSFLADVTEAQFGPGITETPLINKADNKKLTQEVRLTTALGARTQLMVGGFYNYEDSFLFQTLAAQNPLTREIVGKYDDSPQPSKLIELAAFANLTLEVSDRFDIQFGGRQSRNRQRYDQAFINQQDFGLEDVFYPTVGSRDSSFTYLITPRFRPSHDLMVYARLATGYRTGGPNANSAALSVPDEFDPDTTRNYEIGAKGSLLNQMLGFDVSVYYTDWRDIQLGFCNPDNCVQGFQGNGGRARSQGVEVSLDARPWERMKISTSLSFNDATLTEDLPPEAAANGAYGVKGTRLPVNRRFTGLLSAEQAFPLTGTLIGFAGGQVSYQGETTPGFVNSNVGAAVPYARTDIRAGIRASDWNATVFVNNLTDRRGEIFGGGADFSRNYRILIRPRVIGLSFSKSF